MRSAAVLWPVAIEPSACFPQLHSTALKLAHGYCYATVNQSEREGTLLYGVCLGMMQLVCRIAAC